MPAATATSAHVINDTHRAEVLLGLARRRRTDVKIGSAIEAASAILAQGATVRRNFISAWRGLAFEEREASTVAREAIVILQAARVPGRDLLATRAEQGAVAAAAVVVGGAEAANAVGHPVEAFTLEEVGALQREALHT